MKVVITVDDFHPTKWYLEHYLARELARLGHEVHVFTFGNQNYMYPMDLGFKIHRLSYLMILKPYHLPSPRALAYISAFIRSKRPDVIHCQPLFSPLSLFFFGCRLFANYQLVGSMITGAYSMDSLKSRIMYFITKAVTERCVIRYTKIVFAKSDGLKKLLLRLFDLPERKVSIIPLGADPDLFNHNESIRDEVRTRLGMGRDNIILLCSGNLAPSKHVDELIKASAPIIREDKKVKLLILGGGKSRYTDSLKELCSNLSITKSVFFHPWVSRLEIPSLFDASDIAVWPGGASISMLEAASMGLPLISRKSPIESYALSNGNGFFFEPGNISELHGFLKSLIYDEKLRVDMGHRSRELIETKLNWHSIALEYLDDYKNAIS